MERFSFIFLIGGLGFFILAFGVSAYLPTLSVQDLTVQTVAELAQDVPLEFIELKEQYPKAFRKAFYKTTDRQALENLRRDHPGIYKAVFSRSQQESLEQFRQQAPEAFEKVFGEGTEISDAMDELDFGGDEVLDALKAAAPQAFALAFDDSIDAAMVTLENDYPLTLAKIKVQDPAVYQAVFEDRSDSDVLAEALQRGRRIYIGEACWHCHSQQVRPWGNDDMRYGMVSYPEEYHNELNRPPLWGTRRIGPDLIRRGGMQSNDWHVAHFIEPTNVNPVSVMPAYPWFYESDRITPNRDGLSIIAYVQWLGSWQHSRRPDLYMIPSVEREYAPPTDSPHPAAADMAEKAGADATATDQGGESDDEGYGY